jgi:hypothetical protein
MLNLSPLVRADGRLPSRARTLFGGQACGSTGRRSCWSRTPPEDAEAQIRGALRLTPRDTLATFGSQFSGIAKVYLGQDEEAVEQLVRRRSTLATRSGRDARIFRAKA